MKDSLWSPRKPGVCRNNAGEGWALKSQELHIQEPPTLLQEQLFMFQIWVQISPHGLQGTEIQPWHYLLTHSELNCTPHFYSIFQLNELQSPNYSSWMVAQRKQLESFLSWFSLELRLCLYIYIYNIYMKYYIILIMILTDNENARIFPSLNSYLYMNKVTH